MNKLFILAILLCIAIATVSAVEQKKNQCTKKCFVSAFKAEGNDEMKKQFTTCLKSCKKAAKQHVKELKQAVAEVTPQSDSMIAPGVTLQATTAVNVRSGACTRFGVVRTLNPGETVKSTGWSGSDCGHTWIGVSGSFGYGYVSSLYVKEIGGGGPSPAPTPSGSGCRTRAYPLFKQCDGRWGGNYLISQTVCQVGCLMSSVSMALNGLGKSVNGQSSNPGVLNAFLRSNGGYVSGNLFVWGAVSRFGLSYQGQPSNQAEIKAAICANKVVILNVMGGGHWVLATGYDGNTFYVNDSGFNRSSYSGGEVVRAGIFAV
jgi:hypothetical protein